MGWDVAVSEQQADGCDAVAVIVESLLRGDHDVLGEDVRLLGAVRLEHSLDRGG
ncbi:hypothetical protein O7602_26775 [Micromonospora sp. WMMD1128]|uniref:hypothetical protein n=1 Tax=Micromonospora sp. WMMD1128 TaxID=3015150 RepID=UPI00248B107E|nr:hypothetical protein [Micromonospora sp. WMMD1128]WBB73248.1 hypothetical protein O7602_26775 [Micromonospora sp. WMMD1128]